MVQVNWTLQSKFDLKDIAEYITQGSIFYAKETIRKLRNRTFILKDYPLIGKIVPEYEAEYIRELIEGNYRIIYYLESERKIHILGIIHSARDLTNIILEIP